MLKVYRGFAYFIAAEVVIQAMAIAYALAGLGYWVENDGGVLNKAVLDASEDLTFRGVGGFALHGINGMMIIPLVTIIFLVISFFAKVEGGVKRALILVAMVALQVTLGLTSHSEPLLAPLHALNGFGIVVFAYLTGKSASSRVTAAV